MRWILLLLFAALTLLANDRIVVLCYHNIEDHPKDKEIMNLDTDTFIRQMSWLKAHNYHPISIDDLIAAKRGQKSLPPNPVILTFDDGYKGFYTRVFPILKAYNYPAVLAIVGSWLEPEANATFYYGNKKKRRDLLLSWEQLKEIADSGLVEIASHSYDLHKGILANPQGNLEPAATSRLYDPKSGRYESKEHYLARIRADLAKNSDLLERKLGKRPRVMVWPYGEYNEATLLIAKELGMEIAFTLDDGVNTLKDTDRMKRVLIKEEDDLEDFVWMFAHLDRLGKDYERVVHVDLDYVYDPDPKQMHKNLSRLLDRIKAYHITTVYLQAFADPDGDGVAQEVYFPNRHLPMRADIFNRVAWQLRTRSRVKVFAWMPVSAFDLPVSDELYVQASTAEGIGIEPKHYKRLSIFHPKARRIIKEIYEDLAVNAPVVGILYHDDAFFDANEDFSPAAKAAYKKAGLPADLKALEADDELYRRWITLKTDALIAFTKELTKEFRYWRPFAASARNLYATVVLNPKSERWFAQNYYKSLKAYDYVAVMAMPFMEGAKDDRSWLKKLAQKAQRVEGAKEKVVFELQSFDWRKKEPVESKRLKAQMRSLELAGVLQYGYYPDDFLHDHPKLEELYPQMSRNRYPFLRR